MAEKFAIVTGASTGIGFELASIAAENGYDLLVVADEHDVRILTKCGSKRRAERMSIGGDLALVDYAVLVGMEKLDRVFDR